MIHLPGSKTKLDLVYTDGLAGLLKHTVIIVVQHDSGNWLAWP